MRVQDVDPATRSAVLPAALPLGTSTVAGGGLDRCTGARTLVLESPAGGGYVLEASGEAIELSLRAHGVGTVRTFEVEVDGVPVDGETLTIEHAESGSRLVLELAVPLGRDSRVCVRAVGANQTMSAEGRWTLRRSQ